MLLRQKKEVTLPRNHALEQSNHPCHGRLAFFHDNVITFNVFKIAYAFPQQPMDFSICSICGHATANVQQTWILPQKHPMNCHKNTKRFTAKTTNKTQRKLQMNHNENLKQKAPKTQNNFRNQIKISNFVSKIRNYKICKRIGMK